MKSEFQANLQMARLAAARAELPKYRLGRPVFYRPSRISVARRVIEDFVRWVCGF